MKLARLVSSLAALVTVVPAMLAFVSACGEDAPSSPPRGSRTRDGSVDPSADAQATPAVVPGDGGADADARAPVVHPHPLEGTTKKATLVKGGFGFTEGPVWIGGRLLFSDIDTSTIHELLPDGGTTPFRQSSGKANGNAVDGQGRLLTCEGGNQRVTRSSGAAGAPTTPIAATYDAKPFNAPNDVIVRSDGNVYFTDPKYGGGLSQDDEAVYRIDVAGNVGRVAHDFVKPNGIALSPDGATLYVVDNGSDQLMSAPVDGAGGVGTFTMLAAAAGGDGMAVDDAGNLYVATTGGVKVVRVNGEDLGTIEVAEVPANCTFGGIDRRTLYVTARTGLYSIVLNVPGLP
jgi:gluconolactonase